MHAGSTLGDIFSSPSAEGARNLGEAIDAIEAEGCGVIVYLPAQADLGSELADLMRRSESKGGETPQPPALVPRPHGGTLREYGLGAQVLRELGVRKLRLLTNNPKKIAGIQGHGLELVTQVPLGASKNP
jgi:3,4-dihydroxy 2-butanone 4-phosphate synthase/GTP cyclohydrolase II